MLKAQESPYIKTLHYDNADDFINAISYKGELYELINDHYIFRGHSTEEYGLLPTALRKYLVFENEKPVEFSSDEQRKMYVYLATTEYSQILEEYRLLQDFFNACDKNGLYVPHIESLRNSFCPGIDVDILLLENPWIPRRYWGLAALAQHHGVKTRLLDWSYDINVALYFATTGVYNDPNEKLDLMEALKGHRKGEDCPPKHNMELWVLNTDVVMAKPKQVPLHIIQPRYYNNDNLCAQKGVLTYWKSIHPALFKENGKLDLGAVTDRRTLDVQIDSYLRDNNVPEKTYLYRITIPQDAAYDIYSYIEKMGYNASTLFPGYDGVAKYLREHREIIHKRGKNVI